VSNPPEALAIADEIVRMHENPVYEGKMRVSDHRERSDRAIVNTRIGIVNTKIGHGEHLDRPS
jgi:hypothetical protein